MTSHHSTRRDLLQKAAMTAGGLVIGRGIALATPTPAQTEGPFYPVIDQNDKDADMTQVKGHKDSAKGTRVYLQGTVIDDTTKKPIPGAMVEFWQACHTGKYDHPEDPNTAELDLDFQYWAQVLTDKDGRFSVKTIKPGAYPAAPGWIRPPHIHVKVHAKGYPSLTTQLYFDGDKLNAKDQILNAVPADRRKLVVVAFKPHASEKNALEGEWTIFIAPQRRRFTTGTPEIE